MNKKILETNNKVSSANDNSILQIPKELETALLK
jgi:hypothetical protein